MKLNDIINSVEDIDRQWENHDATGDDFRDLYADLIGMKITLRAIRPDEPGARAKAVVVVADVTGIWRDRTLASPSADQLRHQIELLAERVVPAAPTALLDIGQFV